MDFASFTKTFHHKPYPAIDPKLPELNASGKFVVITGGGTGIGKAIATAFAQAGAKTVGILGRRLEKLESATAEIAKGNNANVIFEAADITKRSTLDTAVARLAKKAGGAKVNILVLNANTAPDHEPVVSFAEADFREGLEIGLGGPFNTIQAFWPILAPDAQLFNISSGMAHMVLQFRGFWLYAALKAATLKIMEHLQEEKPDLHIVSIQPGIIATELNARFDIASQDEPELAANFLVWLASPQATFLKGKYVWVNWDVEELKARADEIKDSLLLRVVLNGAEM